MRELALFAGAGGGILGSFLLGWATVCAVEIDPFCRGVLLARQRDGILPRFPIWDDVRTFDGEPWRGRVDVISGGFPCQDISSAGKRAGITGERSGLWGEFARIIREVGPAHVIVENSPDLTTRGLGTVLGDLAALGFDARWDVLGACDVGAPHRRDRIWIVAAHTDRRGERRQPIDAEASGPPAAAAEAGTVEARALAHAPGIGLQGETREGVRGEFADDGRARSRAGLPADPNGHAVWLEPGGRDGQGGTEAQEPRGIDWWGVDRFAGMDDGVAHRMDRVRATGNGQVPAVVRLAWESLAR